MTITIHLTSLLMGFLLGASVIGLTFTSILFDERWSLGFSDGVKAGRKLERQDEQERGERDEP